jgi:hypothetical protein
MHEQNETNRRSQLDKCQLSLIKARDELQTLAVLFEHLNSTEGYSVDCLKGFAVTLSRIGSGVSRSIKIINDIY